MKLVTLQKANIMFADKVVIFNQGNASDESMMDAEVIYTYKAIKQANSDVQILTELVKISNIDFLRSQNEQYVEDYKCQTLYASGEVYSLSTINDTITCQGFYNPHIVTIL